MWYNNLVVPLLRSPLYRLLGPNLVLITYRGRKTGKTISLPANILASLEDAPDSFLVTSLRSRTWWRNLRDGQPFTVRRLGKDHPAVADIVDDEEELQQVFEAVFNKAPGMARYFGVQIQAGTPDSSDLQRLTAERVIIRIHLPNEDQEK